MIGLSFEPRAAFQAGGTLTMLMAGILLVVGVLLLATGIRAV